MICNTVVEALETMHAAFQHSGNQRRLTRNFQGDADGYRSREKERAIKSYTHAQGREGRRVEGKEARKYLERRRILCAVVEETALCSPTRPSALPLWFETVRLTRRCGFTNCSSDSSSFLVLVSLAENHLVALWHLQRGLKLCAPEESVHYFILSYCHLTVLSCVWCPSVVFAI